jgi:putative salt-induced outer membrane protein
MGVWTGKGQLGYLDSQGNTNAESANAALDMSLLTGPWKHALHLDGFYGKSADVVSSERFDGQWQSNYNFTTTFFGFGALRFEHDLFSGFEYQGSATAGVGYQIFNNARTKLSVQIGAGDRDERPELLTARTAPVGDYYRTLLARQNGPVGTAAVDVSQVLTRFTTVSNTAQVEGGSGNTLLTDTFALTVKVSTKLALSLGYNLQDNTNPPAGLKQVDSTETVNLVYAF